MIKRFAYDQIIDRGNICNMEREIACILENIKKQRNTVIFAPRNYGKTSVVQNAVIPDFKKLHKDSFVYCVDFLGVTDLDSIVSRLVKAFEKSFADSFPVKHFLQATKDYLEGINAQVQIDTLTGVPSLSLTASKSTKQYAFGDIFGLIKSIKLPSLVVLDEFQDIAKVESAAALFRTAFQQLGIPIIIMGSQRQMLLELFSLPRAPLASFGVDVEFAPIDYEKYHLYIEERFIPHKLKITRDVTTHIQDLMDRVPEPINIFCDYILEYALNQHLDVIDSVEVVNQLLVSLLQVRRKRFEYVLYGLSPAEQKILIEIAKLQGIDKPNSKTFITRTGGTSRGITYTINKLYKNGILDREQKKYIIADPLLKYYLIYNG